MKKYILLTIGLLLLLGATAQPASAQAVSNDNEDGVVKLNAKQSCYEYVPGQVLLKFKDSSQPRKVRRAPSGYTVEGADQLNTLLYKYGVEKMEQLLPNENPRRQMRRSKAYNGITIQERDLSQLYCLTLSDEHVLETMKMVDELQTLPEVEFAEPNYLLHTLDNTICDDYSTNPYISQQWYLDNYGVKELWNKPIINPARPVIAIIDTGVDMTHPDLSPNLWTNTAEANGEPDYDNDGNGFAGDVHGWDFVNNTPNVRDNNMHGTHVAGIAAAANNGIGIVGANPQALIMPVTVMQSDGSGDVATIVKGINYAVANGATVLNMSLGTYVNSRALRQALENAYHSTVIVAAAGNDGIPIEKDCNPMLYAPMYPAAYSFVLGVQAAVQSGSLALFSNYDCNGPNYSGFWSMQDNDGYNYELQAPGVNMLSTIPGGKYKVLQGTSMAAPLVAGGISALKMVKIYDNQEILWGDLIHSDNIAQAYAITNRPAELELTNLQMRIRKDLSEETEEDYSDDDEVDAGETVDLYPVFRTTFGPATNIKMHLEMGENEDPDVVYILSGVVDFGNNLSSYGKDVSQNPLQLKVKENIADGRHICMKLVATCDNITDPFEKEFVLIVSNMVKISGIVTEDKTLTADHIYYVNEPLGIPEGVTLTIEPGTRLEFAEGTSLASNGKLVANGTPEKPIVFNGHNGAVWNGIRSHHPSDMETHSRDCLYTNDNQTLFTIMPTDQTNIQIYQFGLPVAYASSGDKYYRLYDYIDSKYLMVNNPDWLDLTGHEDLLTDPDFLTPAVHQMLADANEFYSQHPSSPTQNETELLPNYIYARGNWIKYNHPIDTLSYCRIKHCSPFTVIYMKDCVIDECPDMVYPSVSDLHGVRNNLSDLFIKDYMDFLSYTGGQGGFNLSYSNIVNNDLGGCYYRFEIFKYSDLEYNNCFNNIFTYRGDGKYNGRKYYLGYPASMPSIDKSNKPSYLGTSNEDVIRPFIFEIGKAPDTFGQIDLSNMPDHPYSEAHGIVWKVVVNGKDAQDEFEDLAPLGVGRHKFEVYFNRPMNKAVVPQISFGVRDPYTQNAVDEDGSWNEEGTIYTAYKTITGKMKSDGVNRIYVQGAEDNEFFKIPYEKSRFNINIQAAGSMATGFIAEAGLGKVNLTWNNENNDFDDAMGFNVYRYHEYEMIAPVYDELGYPVWETDDDGNYIHDENGWVVQKEELQIFKDTICLNTEIVDIETTEFTDYDVTPGQTYYYYYKVLSTDLQEYDVSNVVAATPLTSELGDANGSGDVDVADVITTVNYAAGQQPKPFIFEAADMNADLSIDILDIIGIIKKILNPGANVNAISEARATYTIENGTLYVESPVALAGVQVQLSGTSCLNDRGEMINDKYTVADDLNGFEHTSAWLSDHDYLFLAYNMNGKTLSAGKHALLHIGNAKIGSIRLSDVNGRNVEAIGNETTYIDRMAYDVMNVPGIYDLQGRKLTGDSEQENRLPKGVYIINGKKVVR